MVSVARWGDDVPGMKLLRDVSKESDPNGQDYRSAHYIRGVCSAFLMRDAMAAADKTGGVTGANIKKAFEEMRDHVPTGLEGVCLPSTFTATDHRGTTTVMLYQNEYNFGNVTAQRSLPDDNPAPARLAGLVVAAEISTKHDADSGTTSARHRRKRELNDHEQRQDGDGRRAGRFAAGTADHHQDRSTPTPIRHRSGCCASR